MLVSVQRVAVQCALKCFYNMVAVLLAISFHALVVSIVFIIIYTHKHAEISVLQKTACSKLTAVENKKKSEKD